MAENAGKVGKSRENVEYNGCALQVSHSMSMMNQIAAGHAAAQDELLLHLQIAERYSAARGQIFIFPVCVKIVHLSPGKAIPTKDQED